jgi:tubby-related protein 1
MQVAVPRVEEDGRLVGRDRGGGSAGTPHEDILARMKDRNMRDLQFLINKPPRWNEQIGAYVLNFNGRVTMASVKNFQLVDPDEQNSVVLQVVTVREAYLLTDY